MNITEIKVRSIFNADITNMRAKVSITLDDALAIHDIKVIQGPDRLFVAIPSSRDDNGAFRDVAHPISRQTRDELETAVLKAYEDFKSNLKEG